MKTKTSKTIPRGLPRFNSKPANDDSGFDPYKQPRPYGEDWPVINVAGRLTLCKFLPVGVPAPPMNFAQVVNRMLGAKQMTGFNAELCRKLDKIQARNNPAFSCEPPHPNWNKHEVPPELLQEALSKCAKFAVKEYPVIQKALARLYAVAWFGGGTDSVNAKRQLVELLPKKNESPITKHIPEIVVKFREMRRWILESNKLMVKKFPAETDRVQKLAELYGETPTVIHAALGNKETYFLAQRLAEVLEIPFVTARYHLRKLGKV